MKKQILMTGAVLGALAMPVAAMAQNSGAATGAVTGAVGGAIVGGPIGAVVGGVGGAVVGGIADDSQPRFREHVVRERRPSYTYREDLRVGVELPADGVTYYEVPKEYNAPQYRYTVVNGRTVLVDPRTRRVVQVIE
jgi:hypothetical protein